MVTDLFIRVRKLNISFDFNTQCYFPVPKSNRLNCTHCFIMKISIKQEVQQIEFWSFIKYWVWKVYESFLKM